MVIPAGRLTWSEAVHPSVRSRAANLGDVPPYVIRPERSLQSWLLPSCGGCRLRTLGDLGALPRGSDVEARGRFREAGPSRRQLSAELWLAALPC